MNYPKAKLLSGLVSEHSINTPNKIALNDGSTTLTFLEIEDISNKLASQFIKDGVKKGDRVCLIAKKSVNIITFAVAIWKAGAVYSPLDPDLPKDRLEKIINNIKPSALVGTEANREMFSQLNVPTQYFYETYREEIKDTELVSFPEITGEDNAIIIHTSGTTGLPKGVVYQHNSTIAYFNSHRHVLRTTDESRCMNTASFHFDVSLQDVFLPIFFGAYVYIYRFFYIPEIALPLIEKEKFTIVTAVSTVFALITGDYDNLNKYDFSSLKNVSVGAEVCSVQLLNKWLHYLPELVIINNYGPSEVNSTTVCYRITEPDDERTSYYPIGVANKGVLAILVDENDEIVSTEYKNKDGELLLGGEQLMHYYWDNEEATEKAFVVIEGNKYYRTGDICFYDEDNNLVYNGRKDFEVKYNGIRINLEEITAMVANNFQYQGVDCHQIKINDSTSYLNMLVKVDDYASVEEKRTEILKYLREKLPNHSIPNVYSFYDQELRTSTGKTDRKLLFNLCEQAIKKDKNSLLVYKEEAFIPV